METKHTFCRICEALCGLEVDIEEGQVAAIRPDKAHVGTRGFACIKGLRQHELYGSPDRLRHPLERVGDALKRTTWDDAVGNIGSKVKQLRRDHGPDSIAMYVGTAAGFGVLHPIFAQGFMTGIGSNSMYSSASQDCSNKFAVARMMYGFPFTQPFPDVDNTECLIVVGANPAVSKWSFLQVSNPIKRLKEICARGSKLYFVDPRRTESAKVAGEHIAIRPNTDVFFYLSFLRELIATGGIDSRAVCRHMRGFERLEALVEPWTPERTAEVTRIDAAKLREMVAAYREADGAALYCSTGVNMGTMGSIGFWLQEVINASSGNLDRVGGTLVGRGVIDFPAFGKKHGVLTSNARSRIGDFGHVNDTFPGGILADEILTPGDRRVRALFVTGGNPLLTMANGNRLREAFENLELLVVLDILPSETASVAHYVLPCTSPLERPDLPFIFPLMLGLQSRPYLQATEAVVETKGEERDEGSIYLSLARASGAPLFGSHMLQTALETARGAHGLLRTVGGLNGQPSLPQRLMLTALLRACGQPGFNELLREHPSGLERHPHRGNDFLGERVLTDDGLIDLAPEPMLRACADLEEAFEREKRDRKRLKLITKRAVTTHNSWTHNHERFTEDGTNHLYMHPDDAARSGVADGDLADVRSATGVVRVPIKLMAELQPGTVALPHGWGHQQATALGVASKTRGVNVNLLAADGAQQIERVSGMAHLTGIVVDVTPAAGQRGHDWSGIAP
jgi:anaerobic selenocysteine-containing dehydrogenase